MFHAKKFVPFLFGYFKSSSVSKGKKILAIILMVGYLLFPFDLIPDFLTFFGIIDDISVLIFIMQFLIKQAPKELKDQYEIKD